MAWFGNDIGGHMVQSIINGTDKMTVESRTKYVYLVYEECHGLIMVCGSEMGAINKVNAEAMHYGIEPDKTPLDYNSHNCYGWEGAAWFCREVVLD